MDASPVTPDTTTVHRFADLAAPSGLRRRTAETARSVALSALGAAAPFLARGARALARARLQVLNFHHVFPDEEHGFRALLDWLVATGHAFVGYGEGLRRVRSGTLAAPAVTFTFDDGLAASLPAARILEEYGARACFFLVTGMVGERSPERIRRFASERIHMPPVDLLDWDGAEALVAAGHEVGSHTHTHPVVSEIPAGAVAEDLGTSRELLLSRLGEARHFSWPYGRFRHFSAGAARAVFEAGFESCASAERGAHLPVPGLPDRSVCVRRDHAIAACPLAHHRWFVGQAAASARPEGSRWPAAWRRAVEEERG